MILNQGPQITPIFAPWESIRKSSPRTSNGLRKKSNDMSSKTKIPRVRTIKVRPVGEKLQPQSPPPSIGRIVSHPIVIRSVMPLSLRRPARVYRYRPKRIPISQVPAHPKIYFSQMTKTQKSIASKRFKRLLYLTKLILIFLLVFNTINILTTGSLFAAAMPPLGTNKLLYMCVVLAVIFRIAITAFYIQKTLQIRKFDKNVIKTTKFCADTQANVFLILMTVDIIIPLWTGFAVYLVDYDLVFCFAPFLIFASRMIGMFSVGYKFNTVLHELQRARWVNHEYAK